MDGTLIVILAGGKSRRMGSDKAELELSGKTLLERQIERFSREFLRVAASVSEQERSVPDGVLLLRDEYPGFGPLAGLHAAFSQTEAESVFLLAVDMPFAGPELARAVISELPGYDACVIRREDGGAEPTFAAYSRSCLKELTDILEGGGKRSLNALLERLRVRYIPESDLRGFDLNRLLMNMNSPEDYSAALRLLEDGRG